MNPALLHYFDAIEARLLQSAAILGYQILRKEVSTTDGKIRIKAFLRDGEILECFEYAIAVNEKIQLSKYSYHWQSTEGALKRRWDNAPHYLNLPNAPHHIHEASENVRENPVAPNFFTIIEEVEKELSALPD